MRPQNGKLAILMKLMSHLDAFIINMQNTRIKKKLNLKCIYLVTIIKIVVFLSTIMNTAGHGRSHM
jgi:hypothetical protein